MLNRNYNVHKCSIIKLKMSKDPDCRGLSRDSTTIFKLKKKTQ